MHARTDETTGRPRVVVVGGGFGGLCAARALSRLPVAVTLLDRTNHHLFQPLLYQVATAALSPANIASPLRAELRHARNVRVLMAQVCSVDVSGRRLRLTDGDLHYDALILAAGATHGYFGHPEWETLAPGLKTLEDALEIRRRIFTAFERAERCTDQAEQRSLLTFVVIGGGATGVELAGSLAEISRRTLARDFRAIDPRTARILLLEGGPRLLAAFPEELSARASLDLQRMGVEVHTGTHVTGMDAGAVYVGSEGIGTRTVLWAAGVRASPLGKSLGAPLDPQGRVHVGSDLSVPGHDEIFVIGDQCHFEDPVHGQLPGVAQVALQMGPHAAENVWRRLQGLRTLEFRYRDLGILATIGRARAVGRVGRTDLTGLVGWLAWAFVHVMGLIGFRNRLHTVVDWIWAYATFGRGARLVTGHWTPEERP